MLWTALGENVAGDGFQKIAFAHFMYARQYDYGLVPKRGQALG